MNNNLDEYILLNEYFGVKCTLCPEYSYYYIHSRQGYKIELASQNKLSEIANGKGGRIAWVHTSDFDQRSVLYDLNP